MTPIKITKPSTIIGSVLLILMALFHGSGIGYVTNLMVKSNAEPFLKEIFPILFILPTLQLLGLAIFGLLTLWMQHEVKKILFLIAILVIVNSILALYLGAVVPSVLLFFSSFAFTVGGIKTT